MYQTWTWHDLERAHCDAQQANPVRSASVVKHLENTTGRHKKPVACRAARNGLSAALLTRVKICCGIRFERHMVARWQVLYNDVLYCMLDVVTFAAYSAFRSINAATCIVSCSPSFPRLYRFVWRVNISHIFQFKRIPANLHVPCTSQVQSHEIWVVTILVFGQTFVL